MQRNAEKCGHCGKPFVRLTHNTPIVNRSFEDIFHLTLFSGPQPRPNLRGGFYRNQLLCNFTYRHKRRSADYDSVILVMLRVRSPEAKTLGHVENVADQLSELIAKGAEVPPTFTFDGNRLIPDL